MSMNKKEPSTAATEQGKEKTIQLNYITISEQSKADYIDTLNDIEMYLTRAEAALEEVVEDYFETLNPQYQDDADIITSCFPRYGVFAHIVRDYLGKIRDIVENAME